MLSFMKINFKKGKNSLMWIAGWVFSYYVAD